MKYLLIHITLLLGLTLNQAQAHTLGIDKADLTEMSDASYQLVSRVPRKLSHFITTPILPAGCAFSSNPRGETGVYQVRFTFTCHEPLTADDTLVLPWQREGVMLTVNWQDAAPVTRFVKRESATIQIDLVDFLADSGSLSKAATRYTVLGIEHILEGFDHLLFVLALLFIVRNKWKLIKTITAFTVAHSITLGMATLGYIRLPTAPVETTIALSIVFLCVEIIRARRGLIGLTFNYPWVVAFAFGLLHGLGFAGALADIGLPASEIPVALLFFNIGVELGQLMFVAAVLLVLSILQYACGITRLSPSYLKAEFASVYAIGLLSSYWLLERSMGIFMIV